MKRHLVLSNVQKNFGPKIAIASLKELTISSRFPLRLPTIAGPITKWAVPYNTWKGNEVTVPSGDARARHGILRVSESVNCTCINVIAGSYDISC